MIYYIVEHPTRGCVTEVIEEGKVKCSWSVGRRDEKVMRIFDPKRANEIASWMKGAYVLVINPDYKRQRLPISQYITRLDGKPVHH